MEYSFWFSQKHEEWLDHVCEFEPERRSRHVVQLNDLPVVYTTCAENPEAVEPFEGALSRFPDYENLGSAPMSAIRLL